MNAVLELLKNLTIDCCTEARVNFIVHINQIKKEDMTNILQNLDTPTLLRILGDILLPNGEYTLAETISNILEQKGVFEEEWGMREHTVQA